MARRKKAASRKKATPTPVVESKDELEEIEGTDESTDDSFDEHFDDEDLDDPVSPEDEPEDDDEDDEDEEPGGPQVKTVKGVKLIQVTGKALKNAFDGTVHIEKDETVTAWIDPRKPPKWLKYKK